MEPELCETILASAVKYLLEGDELDAAKVLIRCSVTFTAGDYDNGCYNAMVRGPRAVVDAFQDNNSPLAGTLS